VSLRIGPRETEILNAHLVAAYPEEGCGALLGLDRDGAREVARALPFDNRREDSRHNRYVIAPEQILAAEREARSLGLDLIGFFHSHPDHPARPSAFDLEHAWPYYSYLIVGIERGRVGEMRSWRLAEDRSQFEAEPLEPLAAAATPGETGESKR
jgi:proteasome lid subunit RPN8/RPN11